jgi:hypothetical protein
VIRRFTKSRPGLIVTFILLWTFHFSFGVFNHYHPEYAHAHDGELQAHAHGGHFHSLELEYLAHFVDDDGPPLLPGETHHHSESLPGSDPETAQYDFNSSGITKIKSAVDFPLDAAPVPFDPAQLKFFQTLQAPSDTGRILLQPQSFIERSPPLRA